ncbi:MAG: hypothetical protein KC535_03030 [Nanoarchaeota archaeon]|nr:hypothetical protein [Nanoarchaeota archaeon]
MTEEQLAETTETLSETKVKTHVITAAQGIQSPYQARMYGREPRRGKPNYQLIDNMENYARDHNAEINICAVPGSYVNEIELDEFFHDRDDVYIEEEAKKRNEQNRKKERERREAFEKRKENWEAKNPQEQFPWEMPMHFFWEHIPNTNYPLAKKKFNSNAHLISVPEPSQNRDPLVGKERYTTKYGNSSIVMPSPKHRLKPVSSGQAGEYPRLMMTTGACTHPSYNTSNRMGKIAYEDHKYGFAVIDVIDDKIFLPRIVPAQKNGTFVDMGIKYAAGQEPTKVKTTALVLGDLHVTEINEKVDKANEEMMEYFKPENTYVGDAMDSDTVSPHQKDDFIRQMNKFENKRTSLEEELVLTGENLKRKGSILLPWGGQLWNTPDNHGHMVYRYLTKGQYMNDRENARFAFKLLGLDARDLQRMGMSDTQLNEFNCIEAAIRYVTPDLPKNVNFLKPGVDRIHWGWQCAAHGHLGKNGARGSLKSLMEGYGKVIHGHVHQLEIIGDSMSVGTSSKIPMDYQLGQPSTSMAGNGVIYEGGFMQGLPIVKGKWAKDGFADHVKQN